MQLAFSRALDDTWDFCKSSIGMTMTMAALRVAIASFPGLSREGGKDWGLLRAHALKIPFIFRIILHKISDNDVIVHGERCAERVCGHICIHSDCHYLIALEGSVSICYCQR